MEKLTLERAKEWVEDIEAIQNDSEIAHIQEDELYIQFIKSLSLGLYATIEEVTEIAKIVYSTQNIDFQKYYS